MHQFIPFLDNFFLTVQLRERQLKPVEIDQLSDQNCQVNKSDAQVALDCFVKDLYDELSQKQDSPPPEITYKFNPEDNNYTFTVYGDQYTVSATQIAHRYLAREIQQKTDKHNYV